MFLEFILKNKKQSLLGIESLTTTLLNIFGGPCNFRRPTCSHRKLSAIFGSLPQSPEIRLFSVAVSEGRRK